MPRQFTGRRGRSLEERFWEKVEFTDTCWLWMGSINPVTRYGQFAMLNAKGVKQPHLVHRVAYEMLVGPIPAGRQLDHLCRVRNCVFPEHLEPVTQRENIMRGTGFSAVNAAKTHCQFGHEYTVSKRGWRRCKTCDHARYLRLKQPSQTAQNASQ